MYCKHQLIRLFRSARCWLSVALGTLFVAVLGGAVLWAASGDLDPAFGVGGLAYTDIGTATGDKAYAVAVQTDGSIVVAGLSNDGVDADFAIARYTGSGIPDNTFGTNGRLTTSIGSDDDVAYAVAIQGDGKIVVAGSTFNGVDEDFALVRYSAAGIPDTTFNSTGVVTLSLTAGDDVARAIVVQSDGKIVVAGHANDDFALVRLATDGSLDTTDFGGGDGIVTTDLFGATDRAFSLAIQPDDGKLLLAGFSDSGSSEDYAVARHNTDGSLDTASFGGGHGWVTTDFSGNSVDQAYAVAVQPDGKIVLAGFVNGGATDDFAVVRYLSSGFLDATFGTGGRVITALGSGADQAYSVAIQRTGKIVVAGFSNSGEPTDQDYGMVRYTVTGTLDSTFGAAGVVTTDLGTISTGNSSADEAYAMALQPDHKIVIAGFSDYPAGNDNFAVVRYVSPNSVPTVTDITKSGTEDAEVAFAIADFSAHFDDGDLDPLIRVEVTTLPLPTHGVLELDGTPVTATQEIAAADLGNLAFAPTADWSGLASFGWNGADALEYAALGASVNLSITAVNDAPSFTAGPNQVVYEDTGLEMVSSWATDISPGPSDEAGQVLTFTLGESDGSLFSSQPTIEPATGDLVYTTADDLNGSSTVTATLWDDGGTANGGVNASSPWIFTITVVPVNDVPSFKAGADQLVDEDAGPQTVTAWATSISPGPADETGQTLTFTLTADVDALFSVLPAVDAATGDLTYTTGDNLSGSTVVTVTQRDSGGTANGGLDTSPSQIFTITVRPMNDLPFVSDVIKEGTTDAEMAFAAADFASQFSDVDGDSLTQIQVLSLPDNGSLALNTVPVTVNQEIPIAQVGLLTFLPEAGWEYTTSFHWNGSDGTAYALIDALVEIRISQGVYWAYLPLAVGAPEDPPPSP